MSVIVCLPNGVYVHILYIICVPGFSIYFFIRSAVHGEIYHSPALFQMSLSVLAL